MSERNPLILTTRKLHHALDQRDDYKARYDEMNDLMPYLGIARDMHAAVVANTNDTPSGQAKVIELATNHAREHFEQEVVEEYAAHKYVELDEAEKARIRQEFIETDAARIDQETAAQVAREELSRREEVANDTERELQRLKRDELLAKIDTDEAKRTLERFGAVALVGIKQEALIAELQATAKLTSGIKLEDVPVDTTLKIGLNPTYGSNNGGRHSTMSLDGCDRVLAVRMLEPEQGILEVLDDSWTASTDPVRRTNAIDDLTVLSMPSNAHGHAKPRISRDVEPRFLTESGETVEMFGLEVQTVTIGDQYIFE